jgi:hypothetical protein
MKFKHPFFIRGDTFKLRWVSKGKTTLFDQKRVVDSDSDEDVKQTCDPQSPAMKCDQGIPKPRQVCGNHFSQRIDEK